MGHSVPSSRRKKSSKAARKGRSDPPAQSTTSSRRKKIVNRVLMAVVVVVLGSMIALAMQPAWFTGQYTTALAETPTLPSRPAATVPVAMASLHNDFELEPKTLNDLLAVSPDDLAKMDIARMNLLCASALPATQGLDIEHALSTLDEWAQRVAFETERHLYRVSDPHYAEHYGNSEPQFRAEMLAQVLQEDLGVKFNPTAIGNFSFADPSVAFIHGMVPAPGPGSSTADTPGSPPGGTCASMPVMYVAVGRRLGYPLKLVTTKAHIFVRWDGEDHPEPNFRG